MGAMGFGRARAAACVSGESPRERMRSGGPSSRSTVVAVLVVVFATLFSLPASASASLPEVEVRHMPEIVEWVYRNGAVKGPTGCGTVCTDLWIVENRAFPTMPSNVSNELGVLETTGTGLWGSLSELARVLGTPELGSSGLEIGWHIGSGFDKWVHLKVTATAAPELVSCSVPAVGLKPPGYGFALGEGGVFLPEWAYVITAGACSSSSDIVWENDEPEEKKCTALGDSALPGAEWVGVEWLSGENYCGLVEGEMRFAHVMAHGWYEPFHFGRPEAWTGQSVTGSNVFTTGSDPGAAAVRSATEAALEGSLAFRTWLQEALELSVASPEEGYGPGGPSEPSRPRCLLGKPVNCATGNEVDTQTDLAVGGRGPGLRLTRTYNSQLAAKQISPGPFGYGWTASYSAHLEVNEELGQATVYQDDGSTVRFLRSGEQWVPSGPLVQATLVKEGTSYLYTPSDQITLHFNSLGWLTSETDRNGNTLTMARNGEGRLESVTDPASRKITLTYNVEGLVESVKDPMGHTVKYTYESKNLASVTQPGEASLRWQFKYDSSHQLTSETDGRSHAVTTEYDSSHRVVLQTDALERKRKWKYASTESGTETTITEPNGSETVEQFNIAGLPASITHASGTSIAATTTYEYDPTYNLIATTDPNKHTVKYGYDAAGDRTSETDALEHKTEWTYNSTHDVTSTTNPKGETTTIKRDSHGNPEAVERPAPGGKTQTTKYKYAANGNLESATDPLERTWKYEYNTQGDRTAETDPEGDRRTWEYNEDSQETATVSPRGHVKAGEEAKYTTKTERDAQGRPLTITDPLGHKTKYTYDGTGSLEIQTDPNGNKTKYTYDADNERTKVEEPNKTITETGYDAAGQVTSQTDGSKHTTKYTRNALERVTEVIDPLERKTTKEYDPAGNLIGLTDPAKRTTTLTYDAANRLKEVSYSDGKTPTVKYEYDADGNRTIMTDGTGTTEYTYDQLDRLTATENGHKETVKYEYDLADQQIKITYPNTKSVTCTYDKDGRLEKVTDWSEHTTKFAYNADSEPTTMTFPSETKNEDKYIYDEADQVKEVKMTKSAETLASLIYTRDSDGQVKTVTSKGLPGEEKPAYEYDANSRLKKGGTTAYEYDTADNPTKLGTGTYKYDKADELETGPSLTYAYNELGERTKTKPTSGPATTYSYDQAGNLTSVERPKEGETTEIKDTYAYDGNGLRASQTIPGTTTYLTWNVSEQLPLLLNDGTNSYIYGPGGLPIEQINSSTGAVRYLHHDQAGSTRLLTGSAGTVEGKCTYAAYGSPTCEGTATTPLGYDAQYTSSDTGLIYLRARVYDPATAQFLTVDPMLGVTRAPYNYANDNPLNHGDASGLSSWNPFSESFWTEGNFISEGPLNPVPYFEHEISSYENGCGYPASVTHGLEGTLAAAALFAGGEGDIAAEGADVAASDVVDVTFGHGARHLAGTALDSGEVESAIQSQIGQSVSHASATGSFWGRTVVGGQTIEYRAYTLPNGTINVGTYYVVP
jgi:RHS repeat-associated protein